MARVSRLVPCIAVVLLAAGLASAAPLQIAPNVALHPGHALPAARLATLLCDAGGEWCGYGWKGSRCSARGFQDLADMCADWQAGGRLGLGDQFGITASAHVGGGTLVGVVVACLSMRVCVS